MTACILQLACTLIIISLTTVNGLNECLDMVDALPDNLIKTINSTHTELCTSMPSHQTESVSIQYTFSIHRIPTILRFTHTAIELTVVLKRYDILPVLNKLCQLPACPSIEQTPSDVIAYMGLDRITFCFYSDVSNVKTATTGTRYDSSRYTAVDNTIFTNSCNQPNEGYHLDRLHMDEKEENSSFYPIQIIDRNDVNMETHTFTVLFLNADGTDVKKNKKQK